MYRYRCPDCSYSAQVCGGFDRGFEAYLVTAVCPQCTTLDDLPLEPALWRQCVGPDAKIPDLNLTCPQNKTHRPQLWQGACPQCQAEMERDPSFAFDWD